MHKLGVDRLAIMKNYNFPLQWWKILIREARPTARSKNFPWRISSGQYSLVLKSVITLGSGLNITKLSITVFLARRMYLAIQK